MKTVLRLAVIFLGGFFLINSPIHAAQTDHPAAALPAAPQGGKPSGAKTVPAAAAVAKPVPKAVSVQFAGCLKAGSQFSVLGQNLDQGAVCAVDCVGAQVKSNALSVNRSTLRCDIQGQPRPDATCGIGVKYEGQWIYGITVNTCAATPGQAAPGPAVAPVVRPAPSAGAVPPAAHRAPEVPSSVALGAASRAGSPAPQGSATQGTAGTARMASGSVEIVSFRRVREDDSAQAFVSTAAVPGAAPSPTVRVEAGENITLRWTIRACHARDLQAEISGIGTVNPGSREDINPDCFQVTNTRSYTPAMDARDITLTASATSTRGVPGPKRDSKRLELVVRSARLKMLEPEINQETMAVTVYVTNDGDGDLSERAIQLNYEITKSGGGALVSDVMTTTPQRIPRGERVRVASISLPDRRAALSANGIRLRLRADANYARSAGFATFDHSWTPETYELTAGLVNLGLGLEVRMNNQRPGTATSENSRPMVDNDSWIKVLSISRSGGWDEQNIVFSPPYIGGGGSGYYFFMNNLEAARARNEFFVREGRFGIRIVFDIHGEREVKGWRHTALGTYNDDLAPDINISKLEIEVLLTPVLRDGRISYSTVTTKTDIQIGGWAGGWHGTGEFLDLIANVNNYIERLARTSVQSNLQTMLDYDSVRTNIENAVADGLTSFGMDVGRIVSVRGSGDRIIIRYLR